MDAVHIHLLLNHVPLFATAFSIPVLLYALVRKSGDLERLALIVLIFSAVVAIPVYLTGEPSEHIVEKLPGVSESIINEHEESAQFALFFAIVTGVISAVTFFFSFSVRRFASSLAWISLIFALFTGAVMARTANLGGQIRHTEIRANADQPQNSKPESRGEKDNDDR